MSPTRKQLAIGAAFNVLAAQVVAYFDNPPNAMQWVFIVATTLAALWTGAKSPRQEVK